MRRRLLSALLPPGLLLLSACAGNPPPAASPAASCAAPSLDLSTGAMNGLLPTASMDEVKARFPCSTGETAEGEVWNYGGGVFFIHHDMYFYTHRDYVEVRKGFAGETRPALLGRPRGVLGRALGRPAELPALEPYLFFPRPYGCVRVRVEGDEVAEVSAHARPCAQVWEETSQG